MIVDPNFKTRRRVTIIACIMALVVLAFYTRCSDRKPWPKQPPETKQTVTQLSDVETKLLKKDDAGGVSAKKKQNTNQTAGKATSPEHIEYLLLLGMDRSKGHSGRTDAILVAALNHDTAHIGVVSIPRDLYVDIPGLEPGRINTVVRIGNRELGPGKGLPLLKRIIRREFGFSVTHTVMADFEGFASIVDALGGIDVDVKCPIEDCFLSDDLDAGCTRLSLSAGTHRLDGATALRFARSRHGRTDSDRARRQQAVLAGIKQRLKQPGTFARLPKLWVELSRYVATDLDLSALLRIASVAINTPKNGIHGLVLRHPVVTQRRTEDGKEVVQLNHKALGLALTKLFAAPPPGTRRKTVCPAADVGLYWRERVQKRKGKNPPPLVSVPR